MDVGKVKTILLLATTLFLISAPQPDSATIAEMTANFIVPMDERALQASEFNRVPGEREGQVEQQGVAKPHVSEQLEEGERDTRN